MWFRYIGLPCMLYIIRPNYAYISRYMNSQPDYFRYRSIHRKRFKINKNYIDCVEDHHIIPKQWHNHDIFETIDFDVNSNQNLCIMPNNNAKYRFNLHPHTLIHQGGHKKYNKYVKTQLDYIHGLNKDSQKYEFWLLLNHLKSNMKINEDNIPWK
jgi:hypothetical protein